MRKKAAGTCGVPTCWSPAVAGSTSCATHGATTLEVRAEGLSAASLAAVVESLSALALGLGGT